MMGCALQWTLPHSTARVSNPGKISLLVSEARTPLIDSWMGHGNTEMSGRYGKQLLKNVQSRQGWAAKVGLGFTIPPERVELLMDRPGQVHADEELARVPA